MVLIKLTDHDEPFGFLDPIRIRLRISQRFPLHILSFMNLVRSTMTDEDRFASPFDDDLELKKNPRFQD